MMTVVALIGFLAPAIAAAYLLLRAAEGRNPALTSVERLAFAMTLGPTLAVLPPFLVDVTLGVPLGVLSFALTLVALLAVGAGLLRWKGIDPRSSHTLPNGHALPRLAVIALGVLMLWTLGKALPFAATNLFLTPSYLDDTLDNWNLRAKVFYETQHFTLDLPHADPSIARVGVSSYPPAVPLMKTALATLSGGWNESAANGLHLLWFFTPLLLLWAGLRRMAGRFWAWVGVYVLGSLPLFAVHAVSAYADAFLASHLLAAVLPLVFALRSTQPHERNALLRLGAMLIGILPFTKNEASVLYLPALALGIATTLALLWQRSDGRRSVMHAAGWLATCVVVLGVPWLAYKWSLGLAFGNAKQISTLAITWYKDAPQAILINTVFEGNWLLLFPLLPLLAALGWRALLRGPLLPAAIIALAAYAGQLVIFTCTPLALEAIRQTGYARGLVHIVPIFTFIAVLLLAHIVGRALGPWATVEDDA